MSSSLGLGVPVPRLLPIVGTWSLPFAAYYLFLTNRVVYQRVKNEKYLGDRLQSPADPRDEQSRPDPLYLATRAQLNFLENVPLAFIFAAVAELNGADRKALNYVMAGLLVLRVAHVEAGLYLRNTIGLGRIAALFGTQGVQGGLAAYAAWLVKGYWGF